MHKNLPDVAAKWELEEKAEVNRVKVWTKAKKLETTRDTKPHQQYFTADGIRQPGVTTITGILDKPGLVIAANKLGMQGINASDHWRGLAKIGQLAHKLIEHQLKGTDPAEDLKDFTENEQRRAQNSTARFQEWLSRRDVEYVSSELQLVSEKYRFGGTGDALLRVDGVLSYVEFKTGGIFLEAELQGAANAALIDENGYGPVEQIVLLGLPRGEDEAFSEKTLQEWTLQMKMFLTMLEIYHIRRTLEKTVR